MLAAAKSGSGVLERSYVPGDAVGAGLVLTSDGWIVTYGDLGAPKVKRVQDLVAVVGAKAYPVRRAVRDPYSGASFLKVDAANLPVTAFGSTEDIEAGEPLYATDVAGGIGRLSVLSYEAMPAASNEALLRSSERLQRMIRASGGPFPAGAMVMNAKGEVVGIVAEQGGFGLAIVPVGAFSGVIGPVLRDKQPVRPVLGVNYVDLSQVLDGDAEGPARGALVAASSDGKRPAVVRKSPAEAAGIRAGDIVVEVDGEPVTAKNPLADVLAEYAAGDTVTLTVQDGRTKKEEVVDVVLGASGAP
jgi:serine protease Do